MSDKYSNETMLDMYIFETSQNIEQLEACILNTERSNTYSQDAINEIFRLMHTIKGSSAMMLFNNISSLAHTIEDLFYFLREQRPQDVDYSILSDLVLDGVDFIKVELQKIKDGENADGDTTNLVDSIKEFLTFIKQQNNCDEEKEKPIVHKKPQYYIIPDKVKPLTLSNNYKVIIFFEDDCQMENIRAYAITHNLKELTDEMYYLPADIIDNDNSVEDIREEGFRIFFKTDRPYDELNKFFNQIAFLKAFELVQLEDDEEFKQFSLASQTIVKADEIKESQLQKHTSDEKVEKEVTTTSTGQNIISVNVVKLDNLMDLVGEMVIAEAMVTQNPDLKGLQLDNFQKAARQFKKITTEIQDLVMSIRMVPLSITFQKMHRIVRDMSKKLSKEINLELIGEETEVDKNIIEHISDPLMHLVRNSIDHGIETIEEREAVGKIKTGKVTLEAKNAGSDVLIIVKDDGKGLNKEKILKKARENDLLIKPESEMLDKEIYNLIFLPGFSTKEVVSEFSGRGVGMDVVTKNLELVGGSVSVDSIDGKGTTITLKIPLTLAIIDGMNISVGNSSYTIPTTAIKESFKPKAMDLIRDPDGNEMIMVRGQCYPILRLHEYYSVKTRVTDFTEGIVIMVEHDDKTLCLFADMLLGQQQVVVKTLPSYIRNKRKIKGLAGCTLLGDGSISLILDIGGLIEFI